MEDFVPVYKPAPLIGFKGKATGGGSIVVADDIYDKPYKILQLNNAVSSWSKEDLIYFATKLLEVANNM